MTLQMAWLETKMLVRDPFTVVFVLVVPLLLLYALGSALGNEVDATQFRGVGAVDYYVPAYVAMVVSGLGLISVARHVAIYRETGLLRRYGAAGMSPLELLAATGLVVLALGAAASIVFVAAVTPGFGVFFPDGLLGLGVGFVIAVAAFSSIGVVLGALLPTRRAAAVVGVGLWSVLLVIGGAGFPREALSMPLQRLQQSTPTWHTVKVMQDAWLGLDGGLSWVILASVLLLGVASIALVFRME